MIQPQLSAQTQKACSVPGTWNALNGVKVTVNANLTGTFAAPYCPGVHSLAITLQGTNNFRVRITWNGAPDVCQSATENMAFTTADCNTAQGTYVNDDGSSGSEVWTRSELQLSLSRQNLVTVSAKGTPSGGTFSYSATSLRGTSVAGIKLAPGVSVTDNPNSTNLVNPGNPNTNGSPAPGGLAQITASYTTTRDGKIEKKFSVPAFGLSCYYTTSEADWGTPPNACKSVTIHGQRYSGTVKDPSGLTGTYCSSFIAEVKLQGSAYTKDKRIIQYNPANRKISVVKEIHGADGTPVEAGKTLARDRDVIPKDVLVDIYRVGTGLKANDTGGAILGYRIDLYKGAGVGVCNNFNNIISVAACAPGNTKCPTRDLP